MGDATNIAIGVVLFLMLTGTCTAVFIAVKAMDRARWWEATASYRANLIDLHLNQINDLNARIVAWQTREREATDRLLAAHKDGYTVPHPDSVARDIAPDEPELPFTEEMQVWLGQWEGEETRARYEALIRRRRAAGRTDDQIMMDLDAESDANYMRLQQPATDGVVLG